jgi:hypothetical protein
MNNDAQHAAALGQYADKISEVNTRLDSARAALASLQQALAEQKGKVSLEVAAALDAVAACLG